MLLEKDILVIWELMIQVEGGLRLIHVIRLQALHLGAKHLPTSAQDPVN